MSALPPPRWTGIERLPDGAAITIRPIMPDDLEALARFHAGQSDDSTYLRFFAVRRELPPAERRRLVTVDHHDRVALVAVEGRPSRTGATGADSGAGPDSAPIERIVGIARFDRTAPDRADIAVAVADDRQRRGIGRALLNRLADAARDVGVRVFTAEVLAGNSRVVAAFARVGSGLERRTIDGVVQVRLTL